MRWSGAAQGGTYEATLLTHASPREVLQAYRAVLQQQPEKKDEVGMMQAMLEKGLVSSAA